MYNAVTSTTVLTQNTWKLYTVVYDPNATNKFTLYLNGTQVGTGTTASTTSATAITIGYGGSTNEGWEGLVDKVAIWKNFAMDSGQIGALYNSGNALSGSALQYTTWIDSSGGIFFDFETSNGTPTRGSWTDGTTLGSPTFTDETIGSGATYGITYYANGATSGTAPATVTRVSGENTTISTNSGNLAKTGYTFGGWNTNSTGSGTNYAVGASYTTNANLGLYAKWNINTYTVAFNTNGGNTVASQTINYNATATQPTPTKSGYEFLGWYSDVGLTSAFNFSTAITANRTLYAKWREILTVSYNANGATSGTIPSSQIKTYDVNLTLVASNTGNLAKTGYKFLGWNTLSNGTGINYSANDTFVYSTNAILTLYAKWQINPTITFTTNGGSTITAVQIESGTKILKPSDPTKDGFVFGGWYKDSAFSTEFDFDNVITANTTLYAKWTPNIYTISYDANGAEVGSVPSATSKTHDINVLVATNSGSLQKAGFKFVGWNTSADGNGDDYNVSTTYSTNSNTTLFAKWSEVASNNTAPEFQNLIAKMGSYANIQSQTPQQYGYFGSRIGFDGNVSIVGVKGDTTDADGNNILLSSGSAYIYEKQSDGNWSYVQKIVASDRTQGMEFGYTVAVANNIIAIGVLKKSQTVGYTDVGTVYIFEKVNGKWIETKKLVGNETKNSSQFGTSLAFDGGTLYVGAPNDKTDSSGANSLNSSGAVYAFEKVTGVWTLKKKITPSTRAVGQLFGNTLSASNGTLVVQANGDKLDASGLNSIDYAGAAYVFKKETDGSYTQKNKIVSPVRVLREYFGSKVSVYNDFIAIGTPQNTTDADGLNPFSSAGAVVIYKKDTSGNWNFFQKVVPAYRTSNNYFGNTVALGDGKLYVYGNNNGIYKFEYNGIQWNQSEIIKSPTNSTDYFGAAMIVSGDEVMAGAQGEKVSTFAFAGKAHFLSGNAKGYYVDVNENSKVAFQAVAIDEGDIVTYDINGTDAGRFDINSTTGIITFKTKPNYEIPTDNGANNVYEFVVSASDGINTTEINAQVTVKNVVIENYAPVIGSLANYEKPEDFSDFNVSIGLGDTEEDTINFTLTNSNPNLISVVANYTNPLEYSSYSVINPTITIESMVNIYGQSQITLKATDSKELSSSKSFTVNVPAVIDFPTMATPSVELNEDFGTFDIKLTGIDLAGAANANVVTTLADDTNITLSTPNLTITGNEAIISFASKADKFGTTDANITVTANGQSISKIVHITVTNVNDAPSITTTPTTGAENSAYSWTPTVVDVDSATFSFQANGLPSWATLDTATGIISGTPSYEESGITTILYSVNDGNLSANYELNITVANTNRIPTDISLSTTTIIENSTMDIDFPYITTTDLDGEDTFSYSICNGSAFDVSSGILVNTSLNYEANSTQTVCIRTTDDKNGSFEKTFTITIEDAIENFAITFDPNGGDSGETPPQDRIEDLNITLSDEGNLSRVSYTFIGWNTQADGSGTSYDIGDIYNLDTDITLYAQWEFFNTPATFSSTPITTATQSSLYTYILSGADVNSFDTLTFGGKDIPSWLRLKSIGDMVTTFAGTGVSGATDGNTSVARFYNPNNIAIDKNKNFYIADNSCIKKIDTSMNVTTFAGSCTTKGFVNAQGSSARFNAIKGIVINSQGDLIVLDSTPNNALRKITPDGNVTTYATTGTTIGTVIRGSGIEIDKDNIIYLANDAHNLISKVTTNGVITLFAGGASGAAGFSDGTIPNVTFNAPMDVTIDKDGNIFVADSKNKAIRKIDTNGNVTTIKTDVGIVTGIDVDSIRNLYFVTDLYKVYKYDIDDKQLTLIAGVDKGFADGDALTVAKFIGAKGIKVGNDGALYIADTSGYRIRKIASAGMQLVGTPTNAEVGEHNVTLLINDGTDTTEQTFTITVANINDKPTLKSKSMMVSENAAIGKVVGNIDAIDIDVGDSLTYAITAGDTNGDFTIDGDGNITVAKILNAYTKSKYTLTVKATDSSNTYATATVTITLTDEADAPVAVADSGSINEDGSVTINLAGNDTDKDNNLNIGSVVVKTQPTNGTVKVDTLGKALYTPNKDFNGADSFSYLIYDKTGLESNEANVTVTINPVNDTPIVKGTTLQTDEDTNVTISLNQYTSDVDGDNLTYSITSQPQHGTISQNGAEFVYTPTVNYYGSDSFSYKVNDGTIDSLVAKIYINIAEINDVPVANVDEADTNEDTAISINVLANDIDDEGFEPATVEVLNAPLHGTTTIDTGTGVITYTPEANWYGTDTFEYVVSDNGTSINHTGAKLISNNALVIVRVASVNDAPVLVVSDVNMSEDDTMRINLIANASDVDNILDGNFSITANPNHGTIDILENGVIVYNPTANWYGTDSFTYKVSDGELWSNVVTMTLNVANVNDAPSLSKLDDVTKDEDFANFTITINGQDIDSSNLTYSATSSDTTIANVSMSGNILTLSSVENVYGSVMVDINVSDGEFSIIRNFELNVTAVDDAPVFETISQKRFSEDGRFDMNLTASEIENQTITYHASSSDTTKATVSIVDGKLVVTPLADAFGTITVEVNATANGLTTTQTFEIVIDAVNDAPIVQTINNALVYKDSGDRNITIGARDIEDDTLTYSAVASNSNLVDIRFVNNILILTPKETQVGTTDINVTVNDGDKNSSKSFQLQILAIVENDTIKDSGVVSDTNESVVVRFEADDITITAPKIADENGTIEHKITIGEIEIISTSDLNGSVVSVTDSGVKTTYEDNTTNVTVEIKGLVTGEMTHSLDANGTKTTATSEIIGAKTTVKKDENDKIIIETKVTDSSNTVFDVVAKEDGTASHKVTLSNGNESTATSKIKGAQTTIKQTGGVETAVVNKPTTCTGEYVKAIVDTFADGKAQTKFVKYNCADDSEIGEMKTISDTTPYASKNNVTIESNNNSTQIITVTPLEDDIRF